MKHFFIAGPCVIESEKVVLEIAEALSKIRDKFSINIIFKASFDKANRTSIDSFRGLGIEEGLRILSEVKKQFGFEVITDIHTAAQAEIVKSVVDMIQIPAFLCRQTDIVAAAAKTGKTVNIKKGQFMAPWDMKHIVKKAESAGSRKIMLTERGSSFGYNNLVVDFRSMLIMKKFGYPVIYDATHSMQLPSAGGTSGGTPEYAKYLAYAAASIGVDGLFCEVHTNPKEALSDASTMLDLKEFESIIPIILRHWEIYDNYENNS